MRGSLDSHASRSGTKNLSSLETTIGSLEGAAGSREPRRSSSSSRASSGGAPAGDGSSSLDRVGHAGNGCERGRQRGMGVRGLQRGMV